MVTAPFVCLQCGATRPTKGELEAHWKAQDHGPASEQRKALSKLRENSQRP